MQKWLEKLRELFKRKDETEESQKSEPQEPKPIVITRKTLFISALPFGVNIGFQVFLSLVFLLTIFFLLSLNSKVINDFSRSSVIPIFIGLFNFCTVLYLTGAKVKKDLITFADKLTEGLFSILAIFIALITASIYIQILVFLLSKFVKI